MTFREARRWAEQRLEGLDNPLLEAELLIRHVMEWPFHELILHLDDGMPPGPMNIFMDLVERRRKREPLQHITGSVDFIDRTFSTGPEALVPRPETETLTLLFSRILYRPSALLDLGTGSGVIAVSLALAFPEASVVASDISQDALCLASKNRRAHGADNLLLLAGDLLAPFSPGARFDGIIANLPYIPTGEIGGLDAEVSKGDPRVALDGGPDGLDLIRKLVEEAPKHMSRGGVLALEMDPRQVRPVSMSMKKGSSFISVTVHDDLTGRPRFVTARKRDGGNLFYEDE